jgi:hypothetical protein
MVNGRTECYRVVLYLVAMGVGMITSPVIFVAGLISRYETPAILIV